MKYDRMNDEKNDLQLNQIEIELDNYENLITK